MAAIDDLISNADKKLVLITPYIQLSTLFEEKLLAAAKRNVKITVVCRNKNLADTQREVLQRIPGLTLYTHDNVHAKCYYNEEMLVLGSMNFFDYSDQNNREMGILLENPADGKLYNDAVRECEEIIEMAARLNPIKTPFAKFEKRKADKPEATFFKKTFAAQKPAGFCIRCHNTILYNQAAPFCHSCYTIWAAWENEDFEEQYCHCCGKDEPSSMRKPLCYDCYKRQAQAM